MAIRDLAFHSTPYVTVSDLAEYWGISRRQVRKHIEAGALEAMVLGPKLYRIRTVAAREFERMKRILPDTAASRTPRRTQ